ncbi:MAG: HPP family protein [Chloroflexota bacterium]|jgi:CBS-domain-containing membrane protein
MTSDVSHSTVADVMVLDVIVVRANAPLEQAAELMDRHHISGLPVVDAAGTLVGVVSQTDLVRARSTEYLWANWPGLAVRHLMTSPPITVRRSTPLAVAAARMERHHIHRLVVVADDDETLPIGILSTTDLVHDIARAAREAHAAQATEPGASHAR